MILFTACPTRTFYKELCCKFTLSLRGIKKPYEHTTRYINKRTNCQLSASATANCQKKFNNTLSQQSIKIRKLNSTSYIKVWNLLQKSIMVLNIQIKQNIIHRTWAYNSKWESLSQVILLPLKFAARLAGRERASAFRIDPFPSVSSPEDPLHNL